MPKTALIAGATGLVGGMVLARLLESPDYAKVVALVRRPIPVNHPHVEQRIGDLEHLPEFDESIDDVFCALGSTIKKAGSRQAFRKVDFDLVMNVAMRGICGGASQFLVVTSVGADIRSPNFYLRTKGEVEEALQRLPYRSIHIFRPSFLIGPRPERRIGEIIAGSLAVPLQALLVGALRKYRPVSAAAVANAMVAAARRASPGAHVYEYDQIHSLAAD
ncbi:MAG: NAD(P)H-binding protein [Bryobacteraceae bacterium]|jgi:Predicted nucleoside-diphosphate-sugar epimerases|nr:NAD(P)H-binding protein [Bryobacteraceae bacterium]